MNDIRKWRKIVDEAGRGSGSNEDRVTAEYEVCPVCNANDANCDYCDGEGLLDRTGEHKILKLDDDSDIQMEGRAQYAEIKLKPEDLSEPGDDGLVERPESEKSVKDYLKKIADRYGVDFVHEFEEYNKPKKVKESDKPYATMDDGPEDYLYKKGKKQKLVGSKEYDEEEIEENIEDELEMILRLSGLFRDVPGVESEENEDGEESVFTNASDFVDEIRGEPPQDYDDFDNPMGDESILTDSKLDEYAGELTKAYRDLSSHEMIQTPTRAIARGANNLKNRLKSIASGKDIKRDTKSDNKTAENKLDKVADNIIAAYQKEHGRKPKFGKKEEYMKYVPSWVDQIYNSTKYYGQKKPTEKEQEKLAEIIMKKVNGMSENINEGQYTEEDWIAAANQAMAYIDSEHELAYDVASMNGQQFENVKHMSWFIDEVAKELLQQGLEHTPPEGSFEDSSDWGNETYDEDNDMYGDEFDWDSVLEQENKWRKAENRDVAEAEMEEDFLAKPEESPDYDEYEDEETEEGIGEEGEDESRSYIRLNDNERVYYALADRYGAELDFGDSNDQVAVPGHPEEVQEYLAGMGFQAGADYELESAMEEDLQNGYNDRREHDKDDYFPTGAVSNTSKRHGPEAAKHGNNPMATRMRTNEGADVYEKLKQEYRRHRISESSSEPKKKAKSPAAVFRKYIVGPGRTELGGRGFSFMYFDTASTNLEQIAQRAKDFAQKYPEQVEDFKVVRSGRNKGQVVLTLRGDIYGEETSRTLNILPDDKNSPYKKGRGWVTYG